MTAAVPSRKFVRLSGGMRERWDRSIPLRHSARARVRVVTPFGWAVAATAVAAWVVASRLGWEELDLLAAGLFTVLVLASLFLIGRAELAISYRVSPARVSVGGRAVAEVAIRNDSKRRLFPAPVELPVGADVARFDLPPLAAGAAFEDVFIIPTNRRAVIPVGPARFVRSDPLGLFRREVLFSEMFELFVHPLTVVLEPFGAGLLRDLEGNTTDAISQSDLAFHSLRSYVPGDDKRHIHWRSSAKLASGDLLVRQFLDTRRSHVIVVLDSQATSYADASEFELAVSTAASFALCGLRSAQDVTLVAGRPAATRGGGPTALDALSRVELEDRASPLARLGAFVADAYADASLVVAVSGSQLPLSEARRATARLESDTTTLAVVADQASPSQVRASHGMRVLRLRALSDLPAMTALANRL